MEMKYYDELSLLQVFHKNDIDQITNDGNISKQILKNYANKGFIKKITHNYYGAIDFSTGGLYASKFLIGSKINNNSFVSHRSAFEFYGLYNQVYNNLYVSSLKPFKSFVYEDLSFEYVSSSYITQVDIVKGIRVTTVERTIIDAIKDVDKVSDIEETLKCIDLITYIDTDKVLTYLKEINQKLLFKKVGFVLSMFKEQLKIKDSFFDLLKTSGGSVRGYFSQKDKGEHVYNKEWQIYTYGESYVKNILNKGMVADNV